MAKKTKETPVEEVAQVEADTVPVEEVVQVEAEATPVQEESAPNPDELVTIYLFKDSDRYKDDVFVAVNGEGCLIQRGKQVMVKRKFAEVLQNSMDQDAKTADLIAKHAAEFDGMKRALE